VILTGAAGSFSKCSRRGESTPTRDHLRIGQLREVVSGHNYLVGSSSLGGYTSDGSTG
jgi:hypothetical protein